MPPWLNEVSRQTHSPLLHDECASNPPSHGEQFRPLDETRPGLNQFLQGKKTDLVQYLGDGGHAFPPLLITLDNH